MEYKSVDYKWIFFTRMINRNGKRYWNHQVIVQSDNYPDALFETRFLAQKKKWLILGINKVSATAISAETHDGRRVWGKNIENPPAAEIPAVLNMEYEIKDAQRWTSWIKDTELGAAIEEADKKRKIEPGQEQDTLDRLERKGPDYWEHKYKKLVELKALIEERPGKKKNK
jgi:hypothetical protein